MSSIKVQAIGWTAPNFMAIQMKLNLGVALNFNSDYGNIVLRNVTIQHNMRSGIFMSGQWLQATIKNATSIYNNNGIYALLMDSTVVLEDVRCDWNRLNGVELRTAKTESSIIRTGSLAPQFKFPIPTVIWELE